MGSTALLVKLDLVRTQGLSSITKTLHYGCSHVQCWGSGDEDQRGLLTCPLAKLLRTRFSETLTQKNVK